MSAFMINLLPDTRQIKQRAHKRRQLVGAIATAICIACGVVILLLSLSVASEAVLIGRTNDDIAKNKAQLEAVPGIIDALTAQQHLDSLATLYAGRIYVTKFFAAYTAVNPTDVALNALTINSDNTMLATGTGKSYASVTKLVHALEAAKNTDSTKQFTAVDLQSAGRQTGGVNFSLAIVMAQGVTSGK